MSVKPIKRFERFLCRVVLLCLMVLLLVQGLMLHDGIRVKLSLLDQLEGTPLATTDKSTFPAK